MNERVTEQESITRDVTPDWVQSAGLGWVVAKIVVDLVQGRGRGAADRRESAASLLDEMRVEIAKEEPDVLAIALVDAIVEAVDRRFEELGAFSSSPSRPTATDS